MKTRGKQPSAHANFQHDPVPSFPTDQVLIRLHYARTISERVLVQRRTPTEDATMNHHDSMTATAKQIAFATKLFNRHASISAKHGCPIGRVDYAEDMRWVDLDPNSARDVSKYISMYAASANEARTTMRRY